jgi:hypothetical protein
VKAVLVRARLGERETDLIALFCLIGSARRRKTANIVANEQRGGKICRQLGRQSGSDCLFWALLAYGTGVACDASK